MHLKSISFYNYRNLQDQNLAFNRGVNFIHGQNGQGKTNIIEGITLLSRGRSFRTHKTKELIKSGYKEASVFADVEEEEHGFNLGVSLRPDEKEYYFNHDKLKSLKDFIGRLVTVAFAPDDLALIRGGPQERRNFLDKHILDINHNYLEAVFSYQRALKNKLKLLKSAINIKKEELSPWNVILAENAEKIMKERRDFVSRLLPRAISYYGLFSGQAADLNLSLKNPLLNYSSIERGPIYEAFETAAEREINARAAIAGTHKDELQITLNGKNSRFFSSQGEARSLVLALKISVLEEIENTRSSPPVLLLDDVDSELDAYRRRALADIVFSKPRQVVITGTEVPETIRELGGSFSAFEVISGEIK